MKHTMATVALLVGLAVALGCTGELPTDDGGLPFAAPATAPDRPWTSFGDGQYEVGKDIEPGTYEAVVPEDSFGCYWERVNRFTGTFKDIVSNGGGEAGEQVIVEIAATDKGFVSNRCGTWTKR